MEIVGHEVCEAGSPLALGNGQFTYEFDRQLELERANAREEGREEV